MSMRKRTTARQFQLMVDFMELHPKLIFGKLDTNFTVKDRQRLWDELTTLLNSDELGSARDAEKWRKSWNDFKNTIKQKLATLAKTQNLDSSSTYLRLSPLEEKVMRMIGTVTNEDPSLNGYSYITLDQAEKMPVLNEEMINLGKIEGRNIPEQVISIPLASRPHSSLQASAVQYANAKETEDLSMANDKESLPYTATVLASTESSNAPILLTFQGASTIESTTNTAMVRPTLLPHQQKINFTRKKKKFKKHSLLEFLKNNDRRKITALERIAAAEERKAAAAEKKAEAMKEIAGILSGYLNILPT
ncbi:uncharacterized protein LOC111642317 isoform X2 [Centruroides sculpturatus]|uniref:uncharacterized protein LOC111642317 isoform X1 n=1 Tax=Centruroides sculpturatus TaxID=218467 RepID=UPI000C6D8EE2|nr:uncharacterized protein LOC111642317 isoform X1 [Centruroides sculpturatus]XP_023244417.1 uncharacterized protein LOC111642317 isoform X2 [Centruroides sculpturatus]